MRLMRRPLPALALVLLACTSTAEPAARGGAAPPTTPEPAVVPAPAPREVSFETSDGVHIAAELRAAPDPRAPLVILVHQLSSSRAEWAPLVERLAATPAFSTLAIDLRGHGASTRGPEGELAWRDFTTADWEHTANDVLAAVTFARSADARIEPSSLAAVGASIGSSALVAAASREPALETLVVLSPGRAYRGFDAITPAIALAGRRFLALVATEETDSVETARAMARITSTTAIEIEGDAHGVALFTRDPSSLDRVEDFLRTSLARPRPR